MEDMPDPYEAKQTIWLPFMRDVLKADERSIIVGHSSGAEAAMRYAEENKVRGIVLVAACHTDLGHASEAISGYYDRPWLWDKIKANTDFITQFADRCALAPYFMGNSFMILSLFIHSNLSGTHDAQAVLVGAWCIFLYCDAFTTMYKRGCTRDGVVVESQRGLFYPIC